MCVGVLAGSRRTHLLKRAVQGVKLIFGAATQVYGRARAALEAQVREGRQRLHTELGEVAMYREVRMASLAAAPRLKFINTNTNIRPQDCCLT